MTVRQGGEARLENAFFGGKEYEWEGGGVGGSEGSVGEWGGVWGRVGECG